MAKGYVGAMAGGPARPMVRRRPMRHAAPKKGYCKHCGLSVTPAQGSPMHMEQVAGPGNAMQAAAAGPPPPDMGMGPGAGPPTPGM